MRTCPKVLGKAAHCVRLYPRNTYAQRVGHDHTGVCEHAPSIQHVNNSELREDAAYESILYFTHHKKSNLEL